MVTKVAREHAQGTVGTTRAAARPKGRFLRYFSRFFGAAPLENPPLCPPSPSPPMETGGRGAGRGPPSPPRGERKQKALHWFISFCTLDHLPPSLIPGFAHTFFTEFLDFPGFYFIPISGTDLDRPREFTFMAGSRKR